MLLRSRACGPSARHSTSLLTTTRSLGCGWRRCGAPPPRHSVHTLCSRSAHVRPVAPPPPRPFAALAPPARRARPLLTPSTASCRQLLVKRGPAAPRSVSGAFQPNARVGGHGVACCCAKGCNALRAGTRRDAAGPRPLDAVHHVQGDYRRLGRRCRHLRRPVRFANARTLLCLPSSRPGGVPSPFL